MKKALAILYSPKTLVDFIWYYHSYGKEYAWDVLCIPCGGEMIIDKYCSDSGLFYNVYRSNPIYKSSSVQEMSILFIKMSIAWITGKRSKFAKKYLERYVNKLDYDLHLVPGEYSILCGMLISLSSDIETIMLEDGLGDYEDKSRKFSLKYGLNIENISSYLFSTMGYGVGVGIANYINMPSSMCTKFVMHPEWMSYRKYKNIYLLKELSNTDIKAWKNCLQRTFCINGEQKFEGDIILFTTPMDDFCESMYQKLADDTIQYILCKYNPKKLYIKKHHRDKAQYNFPQTVEVNEIEKNIPGELILDLIQCNKHIYMYPSNMLVSYKEYSKCEILEFQKLINEKNGYKEKILNHIKKIKLPYEYLSLI